jgi:hypothetical protein
VSLMPSANISAIAHDGEQHTVVIEYTEGPSQTSRASFAAAKKLALTHLGPEASELQTFGDTTTWIP